MNLLKHSEGWNGAMMLELGFGLNPTCLIWGYLSWFVHKRTALRPSPTLMDDLYITEKTHHTVPLPFHLSSGTVRPSWGRRHCHLYVRRDRGYIPDPWSCANIKWLHRSLTLVYLFRLSRHNTCRQEQKLGDKNITEQARMVLHVVSWFFRLCTHRYIYISISYSHW